MTKLLNQIIGIPCISALNFTALCRYFLFLKKQIEDPPLAKRLQLVLLWWSGTKPAILLRYACSLKLSRKLASGDINLELVLFHGSPRPFPGLVTCFSIVTLMAMSHYRERIQSKISKRRRCVRQSPEETRHKLLLRVLLW